MESTTENVSGLGSRKQCCHINQNLLPVKGFYFILLAAVGSLLPFFTIYVKQLGLTPSEAGVLYGVMPFVGFFVRPVIGLFTDKWQKHKLALILASILTAVFYLLILAIPSRRVPPAVATTKLECNIQDSYFRSCLTSFASNESNNCPVSLLTFADRVLSNTTRDGIGSLLECEVKCMLGNSINEKTFEMCFTNSSEEFIKSCTGTRIGDLPVTFGLANLSHILTVDIERDRIDAGDIHCRDYDLKAVIYQSQNFWQVFCSEPVALDCQITCKNINVCISHKKEFDTTFWLLFLVYLFANIVFAPIFSLADATAFKTLKDKGHKFGKQRMWGTVGFALFAITSTFVMYIMSSQGNMIDYKILFYIFAVLCLIAAVIAFYMDFEDVQCGNIFWNILTVLKKGKVLAFLSVVLHFGMINGTIEGFLFWYLLDLGATPLIFGLSLVVNCLFEVPAFLGSGHVIKHLGPVSCLYIAMAALTIRLLGYSLLINPWFVLIIEPLHSITFGLMWASAANYANILAPSGMQATVQGLVGGIHFGIGKGIGGLMTGVLFDHIGERWTFRAYAIATLVFLKVYFLVNYFLLQAEKKRKAMSHANEDKGVGVNSEEGNQHLLLKLSPETPDDGTEADMTSRAVRA